MFCISLVPFILVSEREFDIKVRDPSVKLKDGTI